MPGVCASLLALRLFAWQAHSRSFGWPCVLLTVQLVARGAQGTVLRIDKLGFGDGDVITETYQ